MHVLKPTVLPTLVFLLSIGLFCGCGERKTVEPPLAESDLLIRFFDAVRSARLAEAQQLLGKLQVLYPENVDISEMRLRLVANEYILAIRPELAAGRLNQARAIIAAGRERHPLNFRLSVMEDNLKALAVLQNAARHLAAAQTATELATALTAVKPLAAVRPGATALHADIQRREQDLQALRRAATPSVPPAPAAVAAPPASGAPTPGPAPLPAVGAGK